MKIMMMSAPKPSIPAALFLALLFMSFKLGNCINCPEIEKQSLLSFKQSLNASSNVLPSWDSNFDCCTWKGVVCSNLTGRVLQLHLQGNDLGGKMNSSLLNLKHLKYLDLSQNKFEEEIPFFVGSLTSLEYLNLSFAGFYGKIPHNIGNLSSLHSLSLGSSEQLLDADSLEWLSGLSQLEHLNMNGVNLSKATNWAQQVINKLPSLVELHFSGCNLNFMAFLNDVNNISRSNLATLDLSWNYNSLSYAVIPPWVFQLSNLIYLDMSSNLFEGPIPTMSNTAKLQKIDLSNNKLNSSIPQWLYTCKHLQHLDLSFNELSGKIPREIANLCNIQTLNLFYNNLGGDIWDSFGNMSDCFLGSLISLNLSLNHFSGNLPPQFGEFRSLRSLHLFGNSLSGVIPTEIGNLVSLEWLELGSNKLTGVVTETHFANLSNLKVLDASENHLSLKVSPNWIPPFNLESLSLGSWDLGSDYRIPLWLETQKESILSLDLSWTGIYGNVPSWLWSLDILNLSHDQLDGNIPFTRCSYLDVSSNNFSGPLPRIGKNVVHLNLSNNLLSGDLSQLICNTTPNAMQSLYLEGNHLSGELPDCFMKWQSLIVLNLANNKFSGKIPNSIGFLKWLEALTLRSNNFSGHLPSSLQNCTHLVKIDFSDNNLGGDIPKWIDTRFDRLRFLILRSNNFSGEITPSICQLISLQNLYLSHNRLSGRLPTCLNNLTALTGEGFSDTFADISTYKERASIATKGLELIYGSTLFLFKNIDLSMNNLSGDIPMEITRLVELRSLNLSRNHLTGSIPENVGNMKELESLDFSMNSLSGNIPGSMSIMTSLNYLNLSYNHLTGTIPQSTQIGSFNESSFTGNNLCGLPLRISCKNDGNVSALTHMENQGREGKRREIDWFYIFLSLGYVVGLSVVLTALFLKKKWREAYYAFIQKLWDSVYVYLVIQWRRLMRMLGRNP
ncbi:disease resistance family protein / LRR family protein [Striga hermonthica]|uniref:Disease resistance family protein / LRR family protein n=1 Tax=Striga hermonthica TaxID=68872 RepID=A0A9N7NA25_STRHE|nr:disease resistance family protein / LRR family protein [Striga hermonthica]